MANLLSRFRGYVKLAVLLAISLGVQVMGEAWAREFKGVNLPDQVTISNQPCKLMGVGVRKKFFVEVYLGALYLRDALQDAQAVIQSEQPKMVLMHVTYKRIDPEKWVEVLKEGFQKSAPDRSPELKAQIDRFLGFFTVPVVKGEDVRLAYQPGEGTDVIIKGQSRGVIPGKEFMTALWSIWFGPQPADESLKNAMLGK